MKKLTFLFLIFFATLLAKAQNNFEVLTARPVAGSVITFEYMPRNTVLQGVKNFDATAYLMEGNLPVAKPINLKKEGGVYKGSVKTNVTTRAVFFTFATEEVRDNNNDLGYYTPLYDKKGNELPGTNLALSSGFSNYGGIWGLKRDVDKANSFSEKEFASPAAKIKFRNEYFAYLSQSKDEAKKELVRTELTKLLENKNTSEDELRKVKEHYEYNLKDKEKAAAVLVQLKDRFPAGSWRKPETVNAFFKEKNLKQKEILFNEYVNNFGPLTKDDQNTFDQMCSQLAGKYADAGDYDAMKKYLAKIKNNLTKANLLNSVAWRLSGEGINNKPLDVKKGLELSAQALSVMNDEKKTMTGKSSYQTTKQFLRNLDYTYNNMADTYATLLYHNGDFKQAYEVEKKAVEGFKRKNSGINEVYTVLTEKVKGSVAAQAELEKFFEQGSYTPAMKEQLKTIYLAGGKSEAQWTAYATNLEEIAYNKLKAEVAKKMINLPAPQFALKDMNGNKVALSSLKGKIVVVDFWATWCGPCIASFPGMQMAVNKFKDNPDVVFLFIDTWENDSNRVQKVTEFVTKNKYNFHVLYDEVKEKEGNEFIVVQDFKVEGIPTKFVIDRNSNIRFKTVGFGGSADGIVAELTAMIDMAGKESGEPEKKAF